MWSWRTLAALCPPALPPCGAHLHSSLPPTALPASYSRVPDVWRRQQTLMHSPFTLDMPEQTEFRLVKGMRHVTASVHTGQWTSSSRVSAPPTVSRPTAAASWWRCRCSMIRRCEFFVGAHVMFRHVQCHRFANLLMARWLLHPRTLSLVTTLTDLSVMAAMMAIGLHFGFGRQC